MREKDSKGIENYKRQKKGEKIKKNDPIQIKCWANHISDTLAVFDFGFGIVSMGIPNESKIDGTNHFNWMLNVDANIRGWWLYFPYFRFLFPTTEIIFSSM